MLLCIPVVLRLDWLCLLCCDKPAQLVCATCSVCQFGTRFRAWGSFELWLNCQCVTGKKQFTLGVCCTADLYGVPVHLNKIRMQQRYSRLVTACALL